LHFLNFRITFSPSRDDPRDADEGQQDEADDDDDDSEDQDDSADQDDPEDQDEDDAEDKNDGQEFEFDPATGQWLLDMNLESSSCSSPSLLDPSFADKTHKRKK